MKARRKKKKKSIWERFAPVWVILLLLVMLAMAIGSMWEDSGTTDEVAHIPAGYSYITQLDYRLNPEHPPLVKALAGVPLLIVNPSFPLDYYAWKDEANGQWETGWQFIYRQGNNADLILLASRLAMLSIMVLLGVFLYRFARDLYGTKAGLVALFFYAFSPNIIAHSRLVTTDLGATTFFFISIFYFARLARKPSWWNLTMLSIFFGMAQLAKFSNILLIPFIILSFGLVVILKRGVWWPNFLGLKKPKHNWWRRTWVGTVCLVVVFAVGLMEIGAAYTLFTWNMPGEMMEELVRISLVGDDGMVSLGRDIAMSLFDGGRLARAYGQFLLGLFMVFSRVAGGNTAYFLGQVSNQSWWYFYPISFLIKTPIPTLIMAMVSVGVVIWSVFVKGEGVAWLSKKKRKFWQRVRKVLSRNIIELVCLGAIVMFMLSGIFSNLNLGLRHILPLYPFLFLLISRYFVFIFGGRGWWKKVVAVLLLAWLVGECIFIYPSYLAYFNEFIGGPRQAYKYSVDSNLDWGQDLRRLVNYMDEQGIEKMKIDYFGGGMPTYYLGEDRYEEWHSKYGKTTGWLAVSATYYQNSKYWGPLDDQPDYTWLDKYEPEALIGYSILVYHIPEEDD